ncbi:hypothetical protein HaLaN_21101 [Haematococcus lacustris]|uniref:Uncharacterized protein n=1 Tax=Haematococcus lacustris TaxID=44745 RepID=A0A699ZXQ7_HAELA|nr:hypothetical protein HaLaN_21101 [Haematococcus lacustris]
MDAPASRQQGGLSARPGNTGGPEQVQIQIGGQFDFDREVEGLRAHVGKIKEATQLLVYDVEPQSSISSQTHNGSG